MGRNRRSLLRVGDRGVNLPLPVILMSLVIIAALMPIVVGSTRTLNNAALVNGSQSWSLQHDGFATTSISCPTTTACFAAGNVSEGAAVTTMTGSLWSTPAIVNGVASLSSISCPTAQMCLAVGMSNAVPTAPVIEQSTDGGSTWIQLSMPSSMSTMTVVSCSSATTCAVGGMASVGGILYGGLIGLTPNGSTPIWGTPYTTYPNGSNQPVIGLSCTSASYCGAIQNSSFFYSTDGGSNWQAGTGSLPSGHGSFFPIYVGVSCASSGSSSTCAAVGGYSTFGGQAGIIGATSDSGANWTPTSGTSVGVNLFQVACGSTTYCLTVGQQSFGNWIGPIAATYQPPTQTLQMSTLPVTDTSVDASRLNAVACPSATTCFIGGSSGIEETTDGMTFTPVAFETPPLSQISCGSSRDCLAITSIGGLAATNDGGAVWFTLPPLQNGNCLTTSTCDVPKAVACSTASNCILSYYGGSQSTVLTNDLGLTWTPINPNFDATNALACAVGTSVPLCEGIGNYRTGGWPVDISTNGGGTFTSVSAAVTDGSTAAAVSCGSSSMCMAVGSSTSVQVTTNTSGTWTNAAIPTGITGLSLNAVSCPNGTTCLAVGNAGTVVLFSLSGSTWSVTNLTGTTGIPPGNLNLEAVACDSASTCSIFSGQTKPALSAQTTNLAPSGTTFSAITAVPSQAAGFTGAACAGTGNCFAVGFTNNGGVSGAVVLSTNGISSPTFLPASLIASESYGGPDGSRPCFACALKSAGLSAQGFAAEPINTSDGDFYESIPIVSIPGLGPNLSFTATYDSQLAQAEMVNQASSPGPLGWGWSTNASMTLSIGSGGTVTVNEEGGAQISYSAVSSGPGFGISCTTSLPSLQCYASPQGDVTAVLEGFPGSSTYVFSRDGGHTKYTFGSTGQLTGITDANGYTETFATVTSGPNCSTSGTICTEEKDAEGRALDVVMNSTGAQAGLVSKVVDPAGRTWTFSYDANNNLTSITNPRLKVESFGYDTASPNSTMVHNMTSMVLPNGQTGGPDAGSGYTIVYEESNSDTAAPLGYVLSQTDPAGIKTSFSYSGAYAPSGAGSTASSGITTITRYIPGSTSVESESQDEYLNGELYAHVDGVGSTSTHSETRSYFRNAQQMPTVVTDGNGNTSTYTYDGNGNLLTSTDASNNTWTFTYNQFNELLTSLPPSGSAEAEQVNTYDSDGNLLTSRVHPSSGSNLTTTSTVCESGVPGTCTVGSNVYQQGEVEQMSDPKGQATTDAYDTFGDLILSTDANGDKTAYAYTTVGQRYCSVSPNETHAGVNCPSSPTATPTPGASTVSFDSSDTLLATSSNADGSTTTYGYDPDGNRTSVEDPLSNTTVTGYDADDRVNSVTQGSGSSAQTETTTAYDVVPAASGSCLNTVTGATFCTVVTQASGTSVAETSTYYYDAFGNQIESVEPNGATTTQTFDQANNTHTSTTPGGTTTFAYQPNNWLQSETYSNPGTGYGAISTPTSFTYYPDGVRHTMTDTTGTTTDTYDPYGRLQSEVNGAGATTTYGYDNASNTTCISYPNSSSNTCQNEGSGAGIATYGYNSANQMTSVSDWQGYEVKFTPDQDGNLKTQVNAVSSGYPSGTSSSTFSYDAADQNTQVASTLTQSCSSSNETLTQSLSPPASPLNADGQVTEDTESYSGSCSGQTGYQRNYSYDADGRVVYQGSSAQGSNSNNDAYDAAGNPTTISSHDASGQFDTYTQNFSNGEAQSQTSGGVSTTYGYDSLGDRTSSTVGSATTSYVYNQLGQMTSTSPNTTAYSYNGDGLEAQSNFLQPGWGTGHSLTTGTSANGVSCVTSSFCIAVAANGKAYKFTGSWSGAITTGDSNSLNSVSCPTTSFCMAVDSVGNAYATSNGGSTWSQEVTGDSNSFDSVSCPTTSFCVAVDVNGKAYKYTGSWAATSNTGVTSELSSVSCASTTFCMALDFYGGKLRKYNGSTWSGTQTDGDYYPDSVSCTSTSFCVAVDEFGNYLRYSGSTWSAPTSTGDSNGYSSVSCPSTSFCMAVDFTGDSVTYNGTSWSSATSFDQTPNNVLESVSCSSSTSCITVDIGGTAFWYKTRNVTSRFVWDTNGSLPTVLSDGISDYIYGPTGEPVEQINTTTTPPVNNPVFMTYTPSDSSWLLTNTAGNETSFYRYDAFGNLAFGTPGSPFGYSGQYQDSPTGSSGFSNMRARWYDSQTGEFTTVDPAFSMTDQAYAYANNDPVNYSDPSGLSGNPVDVYCSGGGHHPGVSVAQACAGARSIQKRVIKFECGNGGDCGNAGCGTWGFRCLYPLAPLAGLACVLGGCETLATSSFCSSLFISGVLTLGSLASGPANTVIDNPEVPDLPTPPSLFIEVPFPPEQSSGQSP